MALQLTDFINLAQVPQFQVAVRLLPVTSLGTLNTGSLGFTPLIAFFISGLASDAEGAVVNDETMGIGFATGTGVDTSPPQQAVSCQIGGFHSSGTADRDRTVNDIGYVAAALNRENTLGSFPTDNPRDDVLDTTNGGGAVGWRCTQFTSAGIQLTATAAGAATDAQGRIFVIAFGFEV